MTSKLANVAKVKALMAKGMGAKEAIKAAYPDWSDEQVSALAAKMGGAEKTAMMGNSPLAQQMMKGSGLPGYSKGGPVKKDGYLTDKKGKPYARVHKGEKVVPGKSKEAKLRVGDLEDEIGTYFNDKDEAKVRKLIGQARSKSFAMRHPILTGIPTLGIAPAIANQNAKEKILRQLLRSDMKMRDSLAAKRSKERAERIENEKLRTERLKATEKSRAARQYAMAAGSIASSALAQRQREQEKKGSVKMASKKIKLTKEESDALISPRLRASANDPRSKEQIISDIHKSRKQMHNRARAGTALATGGLVSSLGSFVPKSSKAQAIMAGGGIAAMLAGIGSRSSARNKSYKLHRDKMTLMRKIREERGSQSKKASVQMVPGHEAPFVTGLQLASGTLHSHYMDKTANPLAMANLTKLLGRGSAQAGKGWKALSGYARKGGDAIESGAKSLSEAVAKKAPGAAAKWAEILKNNPQLASTLGAAKKNWRPLAGGAAAGGLLMAGD